MATKRLRLVSWNICGLKTRSKRDKVPQELRRQKVSIAFLQETHIGPKDEEILKDVPGWKSYFSIYDPISRGVAILINKELPFQYICHDQDPDGGYIVLFCQINGHVFTLVNVYKYKSGAEMLNRLAQYLQETRSGTLVIGGDFNAVVDPFVDRNNKTWIRSKSDEQLSKFMSCLDVKDVWCTKHPTVTSYTYTQNESSSRIDMFLMLQKDMRSVKTIVVQRVDDISDHQPLVLVILPLQHTQRECRITEVSKMIEIYRKMNITDSSMMREISGAEILIAMKSLNGQETVFSAIERSRKNYLRMTERFKYFYFQLVKMEDIPRYQKCRCSESCGGSSRHHLIFAKVLEQYVLAHVKHSLRNPEGKPCFIFQFKQSDQIKNSFLEKILNINCHRDLNIIPKLLSNHPNSEDSKLLKKYCPLTHTVLTLSLTYLSDNIGEIGGFTSNYSQERLILHVYGDKMSGEKLTNLSQSFAGESGLELTMEEEQELQKL